MSSSKYHWYWRRLRAMSPREVLHRTLRMGELQLERLGGARPSRVPEPDLSRPRSHFLDLPQGLDPAPYRQAADALVQGRFDIFALQNVELGNPPCWNRDPLTGTKLPLTFGKRLDYRDPAAVGDIKYLWEINRHLHLVTLAQAYRMTGGRPYLDTLKDHLVSWFDACPFPRGPNWTSSLELGIRLINWAIAWQLLASDSTLFSGVEGAAFRGRWLSSIYQHAAFIRGYYSRFSSANNHLIGEAAGLLIASVTWPYWGRSSRLVRLGLAGAGT